MRPKRLLVKRVFVSIAKRAFNLEYRHASRKHQRANLVVFLSRRTNTPSYDYEALAREFESRGWQSVMHLKKVSKRTLAPYVKHVFGELNLLARCRVAVLDRYDPVISLLDLECDTIPPTSAGLNHEFPTTPLVLQLWHAFGAYKKFGYQSTDTTEGHSSEFTDMFNIHRNYSWIVCSGEQCRPAYAEAFSYPVERIVALNRPEYDELVDISAEFNASAKRDPQQKTKVLMAPTLRYNKASAHPFRKLYEQRDAFEQGIDAVISWSFHPLEMKLPAPGNVSDALVETDIVVTDYSSIVYEAYALGKMVLFYVPDIDEYRLSPGLNADPTALAPGICYRDAEALSQALNQLAGSFERYPHEQLETFAASAFDIEKATEKATTKIVDFCIEQLEAQ